MTTILIAIASLSSFNPPLPPPLLPSFASFNVVSRRRINRSKNKKKKKRKKRSAFPLWSVLISDKISDNKRRKEEKGWEGKEREVECRRRKCTFLFINDETTLILGNVIRARSWKDLLILIRVLFYSFPFFVYFFLFKFTINLMFRLWHSIRFLFVLSLFFFFFGLWR